MHIGCLEIFGAVYSKRLSTSTSKVDNITFHLNDAKIATIEFIPSAADGEDRYKLFAVELHDCPEKPEKVEQTLDMEIGRLE